MACASARTLSHISSCEEQVLEQMKCHICDAETGADSKFTAWEGAESEEAFSTIAGLIKLLKNQKYRRPRVGAMLAMRRLLSHTVNVDHLNLTTSPFGQWCLQALHSSIRELRIAAGLVDTVVLPNER